MDSKHDRYERIVKIARDITIESKRIIFLLHTLDKESKRDAVLGEGKLRLESLTKTLFKTIAIEMDGHDAFQYLRAYRAGLQEFVEAITFYQYLENNTLYNWTGLIETLTYKVADKNQLAAGDDEPQQTREIHALIVPSEYILGVADLTGELMRKCITNLATGDINSCYQTCNFVRTMYKGFLGCVGISGKEVSKKLYILKQSLAKMENVCYMIKVRGSEIPKHMLADVAIGETDDINLDDDEGYQNY